MFSVTKIIIGGLGIAAFASALPAPAQINFDSSVGAQAQLAAKQCAAAVQDRLNTRGYGAISAPGTARVVGVTHADAKRDFVRVRGTATSGVLADPVVGAIGSLAASTAPVDLTFKCEIDYRGRIRELDVDRR
jgi:hypothetical protein